MTVEVEVVRAATDELVTAFGRLLPQLSRSARALDAEALGLEGLPPRHPLAAARVGLFERPRAGRIAAPYPQETPPR